MTKLDGNNYFYELSMKWRSPRAVQSDPEAIKQMIDCCFWLSRFTILQAALSLLEGRGHSETTLKSNWRIHLKMAH